MLFRITGKLMARHSRTPMPTKLLNELPELFSNFPVTSFKQLEIISINLCQRLTRTHHMPITTNSLVVHLIVSLRSQKIHYEKLYFSVLLRLVNQMLFKHHCFFECLDAILPTLTIVVNHSLLTGEFSLIFKTAIVKPLLKKTSLDSEDLKNNRLISNPSFMSKCLKKLCYLKYCNT